MCRAAVFEYVILLLAISSDVQR